MGIPTIFPTGTTIYNPEKAYNGYTLMPIKEVGAVLIDMNGKVVKVWKDLQGFPNKLLPGGYVMGSLGIRDSAFSYQDQTDLSQIDWDGMSYGNLTIKNISRTRDKLRAGWRVNITIISARAIRSATMYPGWSAKPTAAIH